MAAMVNMNSILNGKDSRWLQLEVCREFQRNKCSRADTECKFAHPPANVEVQNGKVTACYDSIKGRCNRDKPPCKYFHPPQHLKDQLLINGRNHLALKNALMQQMGISPGQPVIPGQVPTVATSPYLTGIPANTYSPYFAPGHLVPALLGPDPSGVASQLGPVVPQAMQVTQQKLPRSDRLEMDVKTVGSFYYENFAFSGMVPYKRPAVEKSGIPVYQPSATTYQQLMQLQQPFVPVSYDKVEVCDQRVAVCRDHANGQCRRKQCKYYHIPIVLPPANVMAAFISTSGVGNSGRNDNQSYYKLANAPLSQEAIELNHNQQQQPHAGKKPTTVTIKQTNATAIPTRYSKNLIIIEPHRRQSFSFNNNNNNNSTYMQNSNLPKTAATTHGSSSLYQQQHYVYNCHSPYSPSSASSSSSCSIATSPTLSAATTLSTTSTTTIPTPIAAMTNNYTPATFIKTTPAAIALAPQQSTTYFEVAPTASTFVLSNDYNSNCIPLSAATASQTQHQTTFIYPAAQQTAVAPAPTYSNQPQQHLLKFTQQVFHYQQPHQIIATTENAATMSGLVAAPTATASLSPSTTVSSNSI